MIVQALRGPHSLYRRYQALLESIATAVGLGVLIVIVLDSLAAYPQNWILFIGGAVTILAIRWPALAYLVTVGVMIYPLYLINLYLAVLFVAISALGHRLFIHYLGATILVLATPLLAEYHLHWLVPILGGLWWGGASGMWVGAIAALWGKILGGMAGMNTDWLLLAGQSPDGVAIAARFQEANSLETLLLLVEPFAATSSVVLYHLLQVIGWAVAGGLVGALAWRKWIKFRTPWSILVVTAGGGLIMLATHLGLPLWLQEAIPEETTIATSQDPAAPLFSLLVVIVVGTTLYSLREVLDLPVAPKRQPWKKRRQKSKRSQSFNLFRRSTTTKPEKGERDSEATLDDFSRPRQPLRIPHHSELPEWEPPKDDSGLIMLEID